MRSYRVLRFFPLLIWFSLSAGCDAMMYRPFAPGNVFNRDGNFLSGRPSNAEQAAADYGPQPEKAQAEAAAHAVMQSVLKDPMSAVWACGEPSQGYIGSSAFGGKTAYGWVLACDINGKNSYGAYAGSQRYGFVIYNGSVIRAALFSGMTQQVVYQAFQ